MNRRLIWVKKGKTSPSALEDGIHINDRTWLTLPRDVYAAMGSPERVDIAIVPDQGRVMITPGTEWSVFSRNGRSSPQISLLAALRRAGIESLAPGRRGYNVDNGRLGVELLCYGG